MKCVGIIRQLLFFLRLVCLLAAKCCRHLKRRIFTDRSVWRSAVTPLELTPREAAIAELGKQLFFDPRLSADNSMSCASCHQPDKGWSDGEKTPLDRFGERIGRATPGLLNLQEHTVFMWDGRAANLVDQAALPITSPPRNEYGS